MTTDCRSEEGVTVGLVDAIISLSRIIAHRDLDHPAVRESLRDLYFDEDLGSILQAAAKITRPGQSLARG